MATQEGLDGITEADVTHFDEDDNPESNIGEAVEYYLDTTEKESN